MTTLKPSSKAALGEDSTAEIESDPPHHLGADTQTACTTSSIAASRNDFGTWEEVHEQQQKLEQGTGDTAQEDPEAELADGVPELQQVPSPFVSPRNRGHDAVMEEVIASELLRVTQERDRLQGRVSLLETEVKNKDVMLHMLGG
jgi:hypothetical protein